MTRTCLVSLYGNSNVLAALSAVRWYSLQKHGDEDIKVVTVMNTPGFSDVIMRKSGETLTQIIASQGWPKPILLNDQDMTEFSQSIHNLVTYREILRRFRRKIGVEHVDEIYYAHDIGGLVPGLAMNAFPKAERIIFGDGLGSIYNKVYHMALVNGASLDQARQALKTGRHFPARSLKRILFNRLTDVLLGSPRPYQADKAVLILPMDQTGNSLDTQELLIVPKQQVQKIIADCQKTLSELAVYIMGLLSGAPPPYFLILLANISDGNFTSLENEVKLYEEIIRLHAPPKATVFIKGHPLSVAPVDEILCDHLRPEYSPRVISHIFARYPIEFWSELVSACTVISVAYSNISLAFLYDVQVVFPFNDTLIEKYIHQKYWDFYRDADRLYRGQLANLKKWDGQSVLWRGSV
jgi:hypothetical protein